MTYKMLRKAIKEIQRYNGLDKDPETVLDFLENYKPKAKEQVFMYGVNIVRCYEVTDDYDIQIFDKFYKFKFIEEEKGIDFKEEDYDAPITVNFEYVTDDDLEEIQKLGVEIDNNEQT